MKCVIKHSRVSDIVPVQFQEPENEESWWCKVQSKCRRRHLSQLQNMQREQILSYFIFCSIQSSMSLDETHQYRGGQIALLNLPLQMLLSSRNIFTAAHRIMFNQNSGYSVLYSIWHIRLTLPVFLLHSSRISKTSPSLCLSSCGIQSGHFFPLYLSYLYLSLSCLPWHCSLWISDFFSSHSSLS